MTTTALDWVSLTSAELLLSIRVPRGWRYDLAPAALTVFSDTDDDGYRATVEFSSGAPAEPGAAWFASFCAAAPRELAANLDGYEQLGTDEFRSSSRARVFAIRYRQHAGGAPPTSHVQAYLWANSYRMYVLDATTRRENEARDLPVFDTILRSVRVLPERPTEG